jgi:hypothetical protein
VLLLQCSEKRKFSRFSRSTGEGFILNEIAQDKLAPRPGKHSSCVQFAFPNLVFAFLAGAP